jgi:hypothetical protein
MSEHGAPNPERPQATPQTPEPRIVIGKWSISRRALIRGLVLLFVGFLVTKASEAIFGPETLAGLYAAQASWIDTVSHMNPLALAGSYLRETAHAFSGEMGNDGAYHNGASVFSPLVGLWVVVSRLLDQGAFFTLLQIGLGALTISALNWSSSNGKRIFFGELHQDGRSLQNILLWPLAVIAAASVIAFVMQMLMLGALYLFSWLTGLAALAAGATGVGGFCWYCVTKLGEKGVEHVISTKI